MYDRLDSTCQYILHALILTASVYIQTLSFVVIYTRSYLWVGDTTCICMLARYAPYKQVFLKE